MSPQRPQQATIHRTLTDCIHRTCRWKLRKHQLSQIGTLWKETVIVVISIIFNSQDFTIEIANGLRQSRTERKIGTVPTIIIEDIDNYRHLAQLQYSLRGISTLLRSAADITFRFLTMAQTNTLFMQQIWVYFPNIWLSDMMANRLRRTDKVCQATCIIAVK